MGPYNGAAATACPWGKWQRLLCVLSCCVLAVVVTAVVVNPGIIPMVALPLVAGK
jgi:hypothetical protein